MKPVQSVVTFVTNFVAAMLIGITIGYNASGLGSLLNIFFSFPSQFERFCRFGSYEI